MELTDEQRAFAEALRDFCQRECGSRELRAALTDGGREAHSAALYAKVAELGWLGVSIPEEYGGSGGSLVDQCVFYEEMYRGMAPVAGAGSSSTVAGVYKRFGSEEQKQRGLGAIVDGNVMSISISEPEAGSDVGNVKCRADLDGDTYVINGQKTWCSYAQYATDIMLLARTDRNGRPHDGLTLLEIPADAEGLEIRQIDTMGGREVNDLFFTDVRVPAANVVGEVGAGFKHIMSGLDGERLVAAAQGLGMAQRAFDDLLTYVKERKQFGKPIGSFQALRHRIADLATEIECSKLITYEVAKKVALEGMQMMGGYGYATEYDMERHVRNALAPPIYAGTNEIQREIISGSYGLRG
jgi:alkylation response protein AidB-like acyl-CoA dehydrogenase